MHTGAGKRFLSRDKTFAVAIGLLAVSNCVPLPGLETVGFLLSRFKEAHMHGSRAVALALLVCLGTLAGVTVGATQQDAGTSMSVRTVENTSNYLGPDGGNVDRSGQATTSLDVAAAVGANAGSVRSTFSTVSLERKYDGAESSEERRAVVRNGTDRLADRVATLERRETAAIDRYSRGVISEADLFRTLAAIAVEAEAQASTATYLQNRASGLDMDATLDRLSPLQIRLVPLHGPVKEDVADGLDDRGEARVHVETAGGGLVLATVRRQDNGEYVYVREAYSPAIRNVRATDRYGGNVIRADERLRESYPWVTPEQGENVEGASLTGSRGALLYTIQYSHQHGRTKPYLDGGSGRVVRDIQRKNVDRVPTEDRNLTSEGGDLLVRVERTRPGGPLGVTAFDNATDQRVNASVSVDGEPVGHTRGERLWTVEPRGETEVTVSHDGETVSVTPGSEPDLPGS